MRVVWNGIEVTQSTVDDMAANAIVDAVVFTSWRCPGCKRRWMKKGVITGQLKKCSSCGVRFFVHRINRQ